MEVIIACGLADPKGAWGAFLIKGIYDPRLFLYVAVYKGETLEELTRWALKGIEVLPLPESEVDECDKLLEKLTRRVKSKHHWLVQTNKVDMAIHLLRKYSKERAHGNADKQWTIIVHRVVIPNLKKACRQSDVDCIEAMIEYILVPSWKCAMDRLCSYTKNEFYLKYKP